MNKNINNRGFTLVELLAVMVILISISLVAVVTISSSLDRRDDKECKEQIQLAIDAAKIYFSLNGTTSVSIDDLRDGRYITDEKKVNRLNDDDTISIDTDNDKYLYSGSGECS